MKGLVPKNLSQNSWRVWIWFQPVEYYFEKQVLKYIMEEDERRSMIDIFWLILVTEFPVHLYSTFSFNPPQCARPIMCNISYTVEQVVTGAIRWRVTSRGLNRRLWVRSSGMHGPLQWEKWYTVHTHEWTRIRSIDSMLVNDWENYVINVSEYYNYDDSGLILLYMQHFTHSEYHFSNFIDTNELRARPIRLNRWGLSWKPWEQWALIRCCQNLQVITQGWTVATYEIRRWSCNSKAFHRNIDGL